MTLTETTQDLLNRLEGGTTTFTEEIGELGLNEDEIYDAVNIEGNVQGRSIQMIHEHGSPALLFAFGIIVGASLQNNR